MFVRTPYNFNYWDVRNGAPRDMGAELDAVKRGYAYVEMNERGHFFSEGNYDILGPPLTDGYDAIKWMSTQPWANGTHWTTSAAFDPANDSTTQARLIAFDDSRIALVRMIGESPDRNESLEIVSRTSRDVLWTKYLMSPEAPLLIKDGTDTITLLTSGGHGTVRAFVPITTLSRERVHCE